MIGIVSIVAVARIIDITIVCLSVSLSPRLSVSLSLCLTISLSLCLAVRTLQTRGAGGLVRRLKRMALASAARPRTELPGNVTPRSGRRRASPATAGPLRVFL